MKIGGHLIEPGQTKKIFLQVGKIYDSTDLNMPVHVIRGTEDGPTIFISAAVHGDEINGIEIVKEVMRTLSKTKIKGTVIAVPIVNVFGFNNQSRYLPDRRDLNRSFPGSASGSLASRMAHLFVKEIVSKCDYGIDFHTGAVRRSNFPQIRVNTKNPKSLKFAKTFGAPLLVDSNVRDGSLREMGNKLGVVTLVYEAGEALRFNSEYIRIGKMGCLNAMYSLGIYQLKPAKIESTLAKTPILVKDSFWLRSPMGGTLRLKVKLGKFVKVGDKIGEISGPFGQKIETILAPQMGVIISINNLPLVTVGTAIAHIGTYEKGKKTNQRAYQTDDSFVN